ncbi:MAG TPA: (2Fe-2S)-binding protein [Thermoplasmata archaeon]|nr:(2Fe-2S)-binding protein [Thermoplasmata archaeon]
MSESRWRARVNDAPVDLAAVPDDERLLDTVRWRLGLKGTKEGCRSGGCGACTVLVDGRATLSCLLLTHEASDASITTIEGLADDAVARRVVDAFAEEGAVQCGYCTPGFIVAATALLRSPVPGGRSPDALLEDLQGNLCRCTGYAAIVRAVRRAGEGTP